MTCSTRNFNNFTSLCKPWDITTQTKTNDLANLYTQETLSIAGAQVNVFKLLGIHEQTKLIDLIGNGNAISSGDAPNYSKDNAFDKLKTVWRSKQTGQMLLFSGYIGYDFGVLKLPNGRQRYGINASISHEITSLKIKQSSNLNNRVTKIRVEHSEDGQVWKGVAIVLLPNDDVLNTVSFKHSYPTRYWRLRPIEFNGLECDSWEIQSLELYEYNDTDLNNIQDKILMENRNRDYANSALTLKGYYELQQANAEIKMYGMELPITYSIKLNFNYCIATLGRPIVIGDIIELPSETQYSPNLTPIKRYLEVTDVTWDSQSYTPGWLPLMLLVTAVPALANEETQDIFGDLAPTIDSSGLFELDTSKYQDVLDISNTIKTKALQDVPERGSEGSNTIRQFEPEEIQLAASAGLKHINKLGLNPIGLYVEDAIPSNGIAYTEGPEYPTNPKDKEYHRLTYEGLSKNVPARLYRYSMAKNRWIYLETDRRAEHDYQQTLLEEYLQSPNKINIKDMK